jgi:nicotinamidase-related amidase
MMDNKSVLVVMDIQKGFLGKNPKLPIKNENKEKFVNGISELIDAWITNKNEVVYVKTVYGKWSLLNLFTKNAVKDGTEGVDLVDSIYINGCHVFEKNSTNVFTNKDFEKYLLDGKFKNVAICGVFAEYCVNQAAITAKKKEFNVFVVKDLVGYRNRKKFNLFLERMKKNEIYIVKGKDVPY